MTTESVLTFSNKFAEFDETNFDDSSGSEATDMTTQEAMFYCLPAQHLSRDKKIAMHEILCNSNALDSELGEMQINIAAASLENYLFFASAMSETPLVY